MHKVKLPEKSSYTWKDQLKADQANKFIGRGSARSSTNAYREAYGENANCGEYSQDDVVFVSAEGARGGRLTADATELGKACAAKVTFVTDDKHNRNRPYNCGEREVEKILQGHGYTDTGSGIWKPQA